MYIHFFTLAFTWGQYKYLSNTHTQPWINVLGHVSVNTKIICKVTLSLGLLSPKPEILLNLRTKCWKSAFNAQGSRLIIVALQVVTEALKKKGKTGQNSIHHLQAQHWLFGLTKPVHILKSPFILTTNSEIVKIIFN